MLTEDPWDCFLCRDESRQPVNPVLRPRRDWKKKITEMFRTSTSISTEVNMLDYKRKRPIRVLSLFDGLGTGKTYFYYFSWELIYTYITKYFHVL